MQFCQKKTPSSFRQATTPAGGLAAHPPAVPSSQLGPNDVDMPKREQGSVSPGAAADLAGAVGGRAGGTHHQQGFSTQYAATVAARQRWVLLVSPGHDFVKLD